MKTSANFVYESKSRVSHNLGLLIQRGGFSEVRR